MARTTAGSRLGTVRSGFWERVTTCNGLADGHHLRTIGAGGKDYGNEVPLCRAAHTEVHTSGLTRFEAKYGIDLGNIAEYLRVTWDTMHHKGT